MKWKKGHCFFQAQPGGFCNNRKVRVSRFSPKWEYKVGSLAKQFLNSTKYIQFLEESYKATTSTGSSFTTDALDVSTNITETKWDSNKQDSAQFKDHMENRKTLPRAILQNWFFEKTICLTKALLHIVAILLKNTWSGLYIIIQQ